MNHLMKAMLDQKALNFDTVITAKYVVKDNTGRCFHKQDDFKIINVKQHGTEYKLTLRHLIEYQAVTVWAKDVVALDGMTPERYVDIYNINSDGTIKQLGKKRGRKSKILEDAC